MYFSLCRPLRTFQSAYTTYIKMDKRVLLVNGSDSTSVERRSPNPGVRSSRPAPGEIRDGTLQKKWKFFLLIEKTLGNVSPFLELALSLSFNGPWE